VISANHGGEPSEPFQAEGHDLTSGPHPYQIVYPIRSPVSLERRHRLPTRPLADQHPTNAAYAKLPDFLVRKAPLASRKKTFNAKL